MRKVIWSLLVALVVGCFMSGDASAFSLTRYAQIKGRASYLSLSNNGKLLAMQRYYRTDNIAEVWQVKPAKRISFVRLGSYGRVLDFTKDGKKLLIARVDQHMHLEVRNASNGKLLRSFGEVSWGSGALSPDGRLIAMETSGKASLREVSSGKLIRSWNTNVPIVSFSPDSKLLAEGNVGDNPDPGTVRVRDVSTGQVKWSHTDYAYTVGWAANGKLLVTHGGRVWNVGTGNLVHTQQARFGMDNIATTPGGYLAASYTVKSEIAYDIELWNIKSGRVYHKIPWRNEDGHIGGVSFSHDGKVLAVSQLDAITIYEVQQ
jgi:WD40 repeat protein